MGGVQLSNRGMLRVAGGLRVGRCRREGASLREQAAAQAGQQNYTASATLGLWVDGDCGHRTIDCLQRGFSHRHTLGWANAAEMDADAGQRMLDSVALLPLG